MTEDNDLLTMTEAGELLGIEVHHVSKLIREGKIPVIRLSPRVIRVPRRLLLERLEALAVNE